MLDAIRRLKSLNQPLVKVYSHPRSGTHLLEKFLADNFYPNKNLRTKPMVWGHWSNRLTDDSGNPLGMLFGNHYYPDYKRTDLSNPSIYIYRDGRAVCLSLWKTYNFKHTDWDGISFSEFLRKNIDWVGSPAKRVDKPRETIVEHWKRHVETWTTIRNNPQLLFVRYEDIVKRPEWVANEITEHFRFLKQPKKVSSVDKPFGLLPNKARIDSWKEQFSDEDLTYFHSIVPEGHFALYDK